jgi:hypothetical protein
MRILTTTPNPVRFFSHSLLNKILIHGPWSFTCSTAKKRHITLQISDKDSSGEDEADDDQRSSTTGM